MAPTGHRNGSSPLTAARLAPPTGTPLYVHLPFCAAKCTYCDFYSLAGEGQDLGGTLELLLEEARRRAPWKPRTVYLGGGTPSFYEVGELERLLDGLDEVTGFRSSAVEVTCECNPESLDEPKARALRSLGVDRLSIGIQSLDARILEFFGRVHDVRAGFEAMEAARCAGFERWSVDLIYGVPGQELARWEGDLERIAQERPEHISAYQLTFEEGTPLEAQLASGAFSRLDEASELAYFESTHGLLSSAGYEGYEISNFCLRGRLCIHNINYWENGEYVGLGPSAVSKIGHTRFGNPRSLLPWRAAVAEGRFPAAWEETPTPAIRLGETWWLGLRTRTGVSPEQALRVAGVEGEDPTERSRGVLLDRGLLECGDGRVRLSRRGWPVADAVARKLLLACSSRGRGERGGE
jgi:oxygen-independent coproporphyrinogen-3 oxidase